MHLETIQMVRGRAPAGLEGYSVERFSYLWLKLYVSLLSAFIRNGRRTFIPSFGLRQRVGMAFVLTKAANKKNCRDYLQKSGRSNHLIHLSYQLFLISQTAHVKVDIIGGDFQIEIEKDSVYKFRLIPVLDPEKAPFVHDLHPLVDMFVLGEYDFYSYANGVVIDVGGYIGDTAVYFAKHGAARVYAYEPNPINFKYLLANVDLNGVSGTVVGLNSGISMGQHSLMVPRDLGGGGSFYGKDKDGISYEVATMKPDELFAKEKLISLLKLDCKGCEKEIFTYSLQELSTKVEHIIVEVERLGQEQTKSIISQLTASGFRLDKVDDFYPTLYLSNQRLAGQKEV